MSIEKAKEILKNELGPRPLESPMSHALAELEATAQELPVLCPTEGNHNWRCECKKCGMKLYINMDLEVEK